MRCRFLTSRRFTSSTRGYRAMADNRKINQGVLVGDKTYTDPDELEEVMTKEMHERLIESGGIEGSDKHKAKDEKPKDKEKLMKRKLVAFASLLILLCAVCVVA